MTSKLHRPFHRALAKQWAANPIEYCELRFPGCVGTYGLAPAHSRDRRDIKTRDEFFEVVAACEKCHFHADREMPKDQRLELFKRTIEERDAY